MSIRYLAIDSLGTDLEIDETRTVVITDEALSLTTGFVGDIVHYTATVKDSTAEALPSTFYATLKIDGIILQEGEFHSSLYDPVTFHLSVPFVIPDLIGSFTVKLTSLEQVI